ncbi:phage regulatory protein/antirepressor Ant [Paraburkholderia tropica]|uniref:phage regulatory protein/antirepressor Ant n=1 Tax=Paraburkholderia tropica TaxID=92647 RepID=UPI0017F04521|nr:phage regulatory protein/antirepressor Ant [Paraburkholderia tropica]MBB2977659.1 phage antirepressor YoqD-like protein [Paraburkholderia tropica]
MESQKTKAVAPGKESTASENTHREQFTALVLTESRGEMRADSRVIAIHLGNAHKSVRELIQTYQAHFEQFGILPFETAEIRGRGQPERFALLNEDQCYFLLTLVRNSDRVVDLKARLVAAFRDARIRPAPLDLTDPATLLSLLQTHASQSLQLQQQVAVLEPKAQALDRIGTADGSMCVTDAAKTLSVPPKALFDWLSEHQWTYRRGATWIAYQAALMRGVLEHKVTTILRGDGTEKAATQVRVTAKGLTVLAKKMTEAA